MSGSEAGPDRVVAGRYRVLRRLGQGGMGVVWLAEDRLIGRRVALKELRAPAGLSAAERDELHHRAMNEARNASRVHHQNAVTVYDVIPASGSDAAVYLVMELIQAPTLGDLIKQHGRLPEPRVMAIAAQMLDVLDAAHEIGVVHRDVKPSNIMVASGDVVKLTDFGIAHADSDTRLTRPGNVVGTQAYLAPELFSGGGIAPAADMWSLGATLFHAAEGRSPFDRQSTAAALNAILIEEPPRPTCSRPLADAISALLVREPAQRADSRRIRTMLRDPAQNAMFEQETSVASSAPPGGSPPSANPAGAGSTSEDQPTSLQEQPLKPPPLMPPPNPNPLQRPVPSGSKTSSNQAAAGWIALVAVAAVVFGIWQIAAHHHTDPPNPGPTSSPTGSASSSGGTAPASGSPFPTSSSLAYGQPVYADGFAGGQCLDNVLSPVTSSSDGDTQPTLADCGQPHDAEVIAVFTLASFADGSNGTGQNTCNSYAEQVFGGSVPTDYDTTIEYPTTSSWSDGYHDAACLLESASGSQFTATVAPVAS